MPIAPPRRLALAVLGAAVLACQGCAAPPPEPERWRGPEAEAHALVNRATISLATFDDGDGVPALRAALHGACAVLVFPDLAGASFLVGGAGGAGVLLVRDPATGHWRGPAFYSLDEVSLGAQVGVARRELVVVLRACGSLDALYAAGARFRLGASFALEALEHGASVEVAKDVQAFSRAKGLRVGAALSGAVLRVRPKLAAGYYGREIAPAQILQGGDDEGSREIRDALEVAAK